MFKKIVLVGAMLLFATNLWAAKVLDVSATRHNFGSTSSFGEGYYKATTEDEVCIYCHTPHGGTLNTPLWNRSIPVGTGFTHYTSTTLSGYMTGVGMATRAVNPESLLCMSCHDGSVSINSISNNSNRTGAAPDMGGAIQPMFGEPGAVIGEASPVTAIPKVNDLSDDHPISFSYYSAAAHVDNTGKLNLADGGVKDPRDVGGPGLGVRLFGADAVGGQRVECSTCHDPHVDGGADVAYSPFLVMPNTGSALCLACHIK